MWQELIQLRWPEQLPHFFVGISLWIGVALSLGLINSKEFHLWKGSLGLIALLVLASQTFVASFVWFCLAGVWGWVLSVRFSHFFQSWWIILLSYELTRLQTLLLPYFFPSFCLAVGLVLWLYGVLKAISARSIRHVWVGWLMSQLSIILLALIHSQKLWSMIQYEIIAFGVLGSVLASLFNQFKQRFQTSLLSEWEGQPFLKYKLPYAISALGLAGLTGWCSILFWKTYGVRIGIGFVLGWVILVLSYYRIAHYLFLNRSLQPVINKV